MKSMFRQEYAQLSIFADLNSEQISQLAPFIIECQFSKDDIIFQQGQQAEHIYILLSGEVIIRYKPYDGPPLTVARIEPGGVFGWSSALGRDIYTSDAIAEQDSLLVRLRGNSLQTLREKYPETGMLFLDRLAGVIAERLNKTHTQVLGILSQGVDGDSNANPRRITKNGRK